MSGFERASFGDVSFDRYGSDVLSSADCEAPKGEHAQPHPAARGLVVEEVMTGWCGEIMRIDRDVHTLELEDRHGKRRTFPLGPGFLLDGRPVILHAPVRNGPAAATRTASGSVAVRTEARMARAGRIYVEGRHDAELVERVWGDDLRVEGVVVEYLDGIDDLSRESSLISDRPADGDSACSPTTWCRAPRRTAWPQPSTPARTARTRWSSVTRTSMCGRQ